MTLALALAVIRNLRIPLDIKREVGILATGFTLFTLLVQGTPLKALGSISMFSVLDKLSAPGPGPCQPGSLPSPLQNCMTIVASASQTDRRPATEARRLRRGRLDNAWRKPKIRRTILDRGDRITLGLVALAAASAT